MILTILLLTLDIVSSLKALVIGNFVDMSILFKSIRSKVIGWLVQISKSTGQNQETTVMMFYIFDLLLTSLYTNGNKALWNGNFCSGLGATSLIISSKLNENSGESLTSQSFHLYFKPGFIDAIELTSIKYLYDNNCSLNPNLSPISFICLFAHSLRDTMSLELSREVVDHAAELICRFFASGTSSIRYSRAVLAKSSLLHSFRILKIEYLESKLWKRFLHDDVTLFFNSAQCYEDILAILVIIVPEGQLKENVKVINESS